MSLAILDVFRKIAAAAEGTPYAQQATADAEHVASLVPGAVAGAANLTETETADAEHHILGWLTKRLHPEAATPAVPPAKTAPATATSPATPASSPT